MIFISTAARVDEGEDIRRIVVVGHAFDLGMVLSFHECRAVSGAARSETEECFGKEARGERARHSPILVSGGTKADEMGISVQKSSLKIAIQNHISPGIR
jgi:hypothetical protein